LTTLVSDPAKVAWNQSQGTLLVANGTAVHSVVPEASARVLRDFSAQVNAIALRGRELWVALSPYPNNTPATEYPIIVVNVATGKTVGHLGMHFVPNAYPNIEVGPFGIYIPTQLVIQANTLYALDSDMERIMIYDLLPR
jgi:hypothetical protein